MDVHMLLKYLLSITTRQQVTLVLLIIAMLGYAALGINYYLDGIAVNSLSKPLTNPVHSSEDIEYLNMLQNFSKKADTK